jgi:leucyl aminopeptidase (aminopeptidase T)
LPTFEDIELQINTNIDKRIRKFAKLVQDELNIDLKNVNVEQLRVLKRSLTRLIKKSGLNSLNTVITSFFDSVEDESARLLFNSTKIDLNKLNEAIINRAEILSQIGLDKDLDNIQDNLKKRMRKKLKVSTLKKMNQDEMKTFVNSLMKATIAQTETVTTTAVMGYDRAVTTFKANSVGLNKFKYAGQKDSINRAFCKTKVGEMFSDEESKRWRNGQKSPANIYLGGYNCRHRKVYQVD